MGKTRQCPRWWNQRKQRTWNINNGGHTDVNQTRQPEPAMTPLPGPSIC